MTTAAVEATDTEFGPWNPGIKSQIPRELLPLSTMFRPENVTTTLAQAEELSDLTGLPPYDLVVFRPERLAIHEVLVRVTADLSVPDGSVYGDLGVNFRRMTEAIFNGSIAPHMAEVVGAYEDVRRQVEAFVGRELETNLLNIPTPPLEPQKRGGLLGFLRRGAAQTPRPVTETPEVREERALAAWRRQVNSTDDRLKKSALKYIVQMVTAVRNRLGRLGNDPALLTALTADAVCNDYGSDVVGDVIEPYFREAVDREGYRLLPPQEQPVVMNVKGASASGKSTMRPRQKMLADMLDLRWDDFALISPDIWRKYLLDYESLGAARKYAGTFTGHELAVIDAKLDRYMARKGERGAMSHLLIDRFRFDSFATEPNEEEGARLLTRFGSLVYMFFMITPPDATVVRAWYRGEEVGRYKAVDDLLDHNVEAYTGMPRLFFTWAAKRNKDVHFEFLDNSVPKGEQPRTVAFGRNGEMNILGVKCLLDVDRYRKINIEALAPDDVYPNEQTLAPSNNTAFLRQCAQAIPVVNFVNPETGQPYARLEAGAVTWVDRQGLADALRDDETRAGLEALAPGISDATFDMGVPPQIPDRQQAHTLGKWGPAE